MPAGLLLVAFDGAEATVLERMAAAGSAPAIAQLDRRGTAIELGSNLDLLPAAIWPEIIHGQSSGSARLPYHPDYLRSGEARLHHVVASDVDPAGSFWSIAGCAGRRIAAVDMPHSVCDPAVDGVQLTDWGTHERSFRAKSSPGGLLEELDFRYGPYPVTSSDQHGETEAGYRDLLARLHAGIEAKTALLLELMARGQWDLFCCSYGEGHSAGHQLWHFHDPSHPHHDPAAPADLRHGLTRVYEAIDDGLARLADAAGPGANVMALASHGMGPKHGGPQLLREILARLGLSSAPDTGPRRTLRRVHNSARRLPRRAKSRLLLPLLEVGAVRRVQASMGASHEPLESSRTRAAALENSPLGAIRLNIRGREPHGCISPGAEANTLTKMIRAELANLREPVSGEPIVDSVIAANEAFGEPANPDVPDLIVRFRDDLGLIEACSSSRIGTVRVAVRSNRDPRTGAHTASSRLWLAGEGIGAANDAAANVIDLAPTVLSLLDVPIPASVHGEPIV